MALNIKSSTTSIKFFGIYLTVIGIATFLFPQLSLNLLNLSLDPTYWIQVIGLLLLIIGLYYLKAAQTKLYSFYHMTAWGRSVVATGILILVLTRKLPIITILFSAIDITGALWTKVTLPKKS